MAKSKTPRRARSVIQGAAFRERLRWLLKTANVSARELGELAGVSHGAVGNLLTGLVCDPGVGLLSAIVGVFGVSLDWLVCGSGGQPDPEIVRLVMLRRRPLPSSPQSQPVAGAA